MSASRVLGAALAATLAAGGLAGCSLPLFDLQAAAKNACTMDSECGDGICTTVDGELACVATTTDLGSVIIEVRPTADAKGNSVSHVFTDKLTLSGAFPDGAFQTVDLRVPKKVTFSGQVTAPAPDAFCTGTDGSVPTKVELHAVSPYAGITQTYTTSTELDADGNHRYSIDVPAGVYDVYLKPTVEDDRPDCAEDSLPPRFVPQVEVLTNVDFTAGSEPPARLSGTLDIPKDRSVAGWHLEVVDEKYGLVLSDSMELQDPPSGTETIQIVGGPTGDDPLGLRYYYTGNPIIRLRDANGTLVVHWLASTVDLDKDGKVELQLADLVADPLPLQATIVDEEARGVAASVTIESVLLSGTAKQNASFRVITETDGAGNLEVDLVPGEYRVSVAPKNDDTLATATTPWSVTVDNLGHGKAFVLPKRPFLKGAVTSVTGEDLAAMPLVVTASNPDALTYFSRSVSASDLLPRASSDTTDLFGGFKLAVDPGTLDLSVQPPAESLYPWLIVPRLLVDSAAIKPVLDVDTLVLPPPVIVSGTVSSESSVVPYAIVRVLLPLPTSNDGMPSPVVQIGEAITDGAGHFTLPLPPSISTSSASFGASK